MDGFLWEKLGMGLKMEGFDFKERVGRELYYVKFALRKFSSVNGGDCSASDPTKII